MTGKSVTTGQGGAGPRAPLPCLDSGVAFFWPFSALFSPRYNQNTVPPLSAYGSTIL